MLANINPSKANTITTLQSPHQERDTINHNIDNGGNTGESNRDTLIANINPSKQTQAQLFKSPHRRTPGKHSRKRRNQSKHKIRDEIREKSMKNTQQRDSINQNTR